MSQENMEVVRAAVVAIRDCDRRLAPALFTHGAEWHNTSVFPGPPVCVGLDAIVIGNSAAALHGVPVTTQDIDIFVRDTPRNASVPVG